MSVNVRTRLGLANRPSLGPGYAMAMPTRSMNIVPDRCYDRVYTSLLTFI